jgi:hypothetical protein
VFLLKEFSYIFRCFKRRGLAFSGGHFIWALLLKKNIILIFLVFFPFFGIEKGHFLSGWAAACQHRFYRE